MFSSYFASITEHSFLCICKVFISKEFVRFSYGLGRFYASKRIIQSKDFDANVHAHSVSSAVQRVQCPFGRRWIMCNPFQGSNSLRGAKLSRIVIYRSWKTCFWSLVREIENSLRGAKNLFREIENSLRGANNLFRESENSFRGEIYNRLWEANKSSIVPSTHFFRETMDYLVFETMNKAITSPVFVEQRHLIERVECFCPSAFVIYVRIKLQFSSYKMFVVKGTCLVSSHQYSVQHFYKVFFFIPFLFPLLPLRFHFSLIFFSSILLCYISIPVLQ